MLSLLVRVGPDELIVRIGVFLRNSAFVSDLHHFVIVKDTSHRTGTSLDMLVGEMIPAYQDDALDHALIEATKDLTFTQKEKLLKIIF